MMPPSQSPFNPLDAQSWPPPTGAPAAPPVQRIPSPAQPSVAPLQVPSRPVVSPAGWYPSPTDQRVWQYWDGAQWTPATAPRYRRSFLDVNGRATSVVGYVMIGITALIVIGGITLKLLNG